MSTNTVSDKQINQLTSTWWAIHPDGDWFGEFTWWSLGQGEYPDWGLGVTDCEWDEPTEIVAVRFAWAGIPPDAMTGARLYEREEQRRWFGLTEHDWDPVNRGNGPDDPFDACDGCETFRGDVHHPKFCDAPEGLDAAYQEPT